MTGPSWMNGGSADKHTPCHSQSVKASLTASRFDVVTLDTKQLILETANLLTSTEKTNNHEKQSQKDTVNLG